MNKVELIKTTKEIVSKELDGVTIKDTGVFVEATIKAIEDSLVNNEKVGIAGFGSFEIVERAARECKNPRTGEPVHVEASKAIKFKASKNLKEIVNV